MENVIDNEYNPFGIDCQKCDRRNDLLDTFIAEDSRTLCKDCIHDFRVTQVLEHSNVMFEFN